MSDDVHYYWHFARIDDDGHPVMRDGALIAVGKRYEIEGKPVLCKHGYHGSQRAIDALSYAPGTWVSRRPLEGVVVNGGDKSVGTAFVQQPGIDATSILREFARWCALRVIDLWDAPPVVRRYLDTGDECIRDAARAATCDAAFADAAWTAARAAARDAACNAACAAAWAATCDAAWADARAAAKDSYNARLERLLCDALGEEAER